MSVTPLDDPLEKGLQCWANYRTMFASAIVSFLGLNYCIVILCATGVVQGWVSVILFVGARGVLAIMLIEKDRLKFESLRYIQKYNQQCLHQKTVINVSSTSSSDLRE